MVTVALSGIVLDGVRLWFFVKENHTKYAGYTMPSTYPARLGFLFVGLCIVDLLHESRSMCQFIVQQSGNEVQA
jgi:hypothetical protein